MSEHVFDPVEAERSYGLAPSPLPAPRPASPAPQEAPEASPWAAAVPWRPAGGVDAVADEPIGPGFPAAPAAQAAATSSITAVLDAAPAPVDGASTPADDTVPHLRSTDVDARFPRVNLLPREVRGSRRLQRTQHLLAAGLAVVLLALGGAWWDAHDRTQDAAQELAAAQSQTSALDAEQAKYAAVPAIEAQLTRLAAGRRAAMVGDVRWYELIDEIDRSAPPGVWLKSLTVTEAASAAASGAPAAATDPLAQPAIATISFSGYGLTQASTAAWLDSLAAVPGLADARYTTSASTQLGGTTVTTFSSTVDVTTAALSGLYQTAEG